ncbi:MAG: L,D-transpeptidase [Parcubacteria group bacterium]|jgi:lipoprotein-anchoring transpeptidase ErfK/SrfK
MNNVYIKGEKKKNRKGDWFLLIASIIILFISGVFFVTTQYPSLFYSVSLIETRKEIIPNNSITINFSRPVIHNHFGWKVEVSPQIDFDYKLENGNKKLVITPKKFWNPESEYNINIYGKNYFLFSVDNSFRFKTISYPKLTDFYPAFGAKEVLLDIEDPIKATFDKPIGDFKVKFVISPFKELGWEADNEKNEINLMPKGDLERGTRYVIETYTRYKDESDEKYRKIGETVFETKPITIVQIWEKDFSARLEQAKKFTEAKIKEGKYIDINTKSQVMAIFENGEILDAFMVSSGKKGMETPNGTYHIANKTPRAWSKEYGLFMPYWQALVPSGKFGIHELPEWPGGYKEGQNHLGTPVSHGCVRLGVGPAERVYNWTDIGTPVMVHS